jgi:hypothetical protein
MEEAYRRWRSAAAPVTFPWDWSEVIRPIEMDVHGMLLAKGLRAPPASSDATGTEILGSFAAFPAIAPRRR